MRGTKRVVVRFAPFGETGQTTLLPQRVNAITAAGQDFVRVALMTHIPDQLIPRRVENGVDGDRQFDDAER